MNSLDDETGETTINHTRGHLSFDISSTYYGTEMGGEKFVDASSTNTLCVHQNGGLSPIPSPTPPAKIQELSPKALEDWFRNVLDYNKCIIWLSESVSRRQAKTINFITNYWLSLPVGIFGTMEKKRTRFETHGECSMSFCFTYKFSCLNISWTF